MCTPKPKKIDSAPVPTPAPPVEMAAAPEIGGPTESDVLKRKRTGISSFRIDSGGTGLNLPRM